MIDTGEVTCVCAIEAMAARYCCSMGIRKPTSCGRRSPLGWPRTLQSSPPDLRGLWREQQTRDHARSYAVFQTRDGAGSGRSDAPLWLRAVRGGWPRSGRALRLPSGARSPRERTQAGCARYHSDERGVPPHEYGVCPWIPVLGSSLRSPPRCQKIPIGGNPEADDISHWARAVFYP